MRAPAHVLTGSRPRLCSGLPTKCSGEAESRPPWIFPMAKLLVVDDEKNIRNSLATFFESCGHQVQIAESAARALALLSEHGEVDLIVSAYRMAEMNGLELLREVKLRFPDLLVILITAYATVESAVETMKAG